MTTLILVRHAQSAPRPDLPEAEFPLSELGRQQARDLVPVLRELGVDALASSPYQRAIDTLTPYAETAGLTIAVDHDLREKSLGGWIDDPAEVEATVRRMHADLDFQLPGGESGRALNARVDAALARAVAANPGRTVAVGSHGGVLGHLLSRHLTDLPDDFWRRIRNPHLFIFEAEASLRWIGERTLEGVGLTDARAAMNGA
jgi:2,3-bisphosphoglycerate-dependent phosphoglycerate mutase